MTEMTEPTAELAPQASHQVDDDSSPSPAPLAAEIVTLSEVQAALTQCLRVHPPEDYRLPKSARKLADLYGEMVFFRQAERASSDIAADIWHELCHWMGRASPPSVEEPVPVEMPRPSGAC